MPKVTVLMAVYNGELYLREAIESILRQTFQDFEFLIINDGSTDSTREVILSYNDPRIRLLDNGHNLGLTRSLNRGLELATGEFIARQDADDISEPERLAKQVAFLETHTEVALLGTWYKKIDVQGTSFGYRELPCGCTEIRWSLLFFCPFVHSTVMLRKSVVLGEIGFYNEAFVYAQDYELWSRIARRLPVANLGEYLVKYRITPWSMTSTYGVGAPDEVLRISIANISQLLSWDKTKRMEISKAQFSKMTSLLFGSQTDFSPEEAIMAAKEIIRLHTLFCQYYRIDQTDFSTNCARVCSRISRRLIDVAHYYFNQGYYAVARQLLLEAFRLYRPILLTKKSNWLFFKLLMGPRVVRAIRRLTQK